MIFGVILVQNLELVLKNRPLFGLFPVLEGKCVEVIRIFIFIVLNCNKVLCEFRGINNGVLTV